jgi:hypothetical protein
MAAKVYVVLRDVEGRVTCQVVQGTAAAPVPPVVVHSPDGFDIGHHGSGPGDLALSILADYCAEAPADPRRRCALKPGVWRCWTWHQDFKRHFLAPQEVERGGHALIRGEDIAAWLAQVQAENRQGGRDTAW